ncbi:hypothetical protein ACWCQQ_47065, partial [Streptomyces sp. NPDC002143]
LGPRDGRLCTLTPSAIASGAPDGVERAHHVVVGRRSSVVDQLLTEMRMTRRPCQVEPLIQAVPSSSNRARTRSVRSSSPNSAQTWGEDDVVEDGRPLDLGDARGERAGMPAQPFDQVGHT